MKIAGSIRNSFSPPTSGTQGTAPEPADRKRAETIRTQDAFVPSAGAAKAAAGSPPGNGAQIRTLAQMGLEASRNAGLSSLNKTRQIGYDALKNIDSAASGQNKAATLGLLALDATKDNTSGHQAATATLQAIARGRDDSPLELAILGFAIMKGALGYKHAAKMGSAMVEHLQQHHPDPSIRAKAEATMETVAATRSKYEQQEALLAFFKQLAGDEAPKAAVAMQAMEALDAVRAQSSQRKVRKVGGGALEAIDQATGGKNLAATLGLAALKATGQDETNQATIAHTLEAIAYGHDTTNADVGALGLDLMRSGINKTNQVMVGTAVVEQFEQHHPDPVVRAMAAGTLRSGKSSLADARLDTFANFFTQLRGL